MLELVILSVPCFFLVPLYLAEEEEEIILPERYYPESVQALCRATKFNEDEIKRMYRGFKAQCPTGYIREETFKEIYSQFFPLGGLFKLFIFIKLK